MHHTSRRFGQKPQHLLNHQIKAATVRVLNEEGEQLGVIPIQQAMRQAREMEVDLIAITPNANPPVCQLCDYGKFLYRLAKKEKDQKPNHKLKEIQLSANIADHDLSVKLRHTAELLQEEHPVRVVMQLKGREKAHPEIGRQVFMRFVDTLTKAGFTPPKVTENGSQFFCVFQGRKPQVTSKPPVNGHHPPLMLAEGETRTAVIHQEGSYAAVVPSQPAPTKALKGPSQPAPPSAAEVLAPGSCSARPSAAAKGGLPEAYCH